MGRFAPLIPMFPNQWVGTMIAVETPEILHHCLYNQCVCSSLCQGAISNVIVWRHEDGYQATNSFQHLHSLTTAFLFRIFGPLERILSYTVCQIVI